MWLRLRHLLKNENTYKRGSHTIHVESIIYTRVINPEHYMTINKLYTHLAIATCITKYHNGW